MKIILFSLFVGLTSLSFSQQDSIVVYFEYDSFELKDVERQKITKMNEFLTIEAVELVSISAFCDTSGSASYNNILAQKRMDEVDNVLYNSLKVKNRKVIGEDYQISTAYSPEDFRKVVVLLKWNDIVELIDVGFSEQEKKAKVLTNEFVAFLQDSSVEEVTIDINILFVPGKPYYLQESEKELFVFFDFLKYNPTISVSIRGHVCCSDDYPLSVARAKTVYDFVIERGISPNRLSYKGFSNSLPAISPEITEEDMKRNRRVSVVIKK